MGCIGRPSCLLNVLSETVPSNPMNVLMIKDGFDSMVWLSPVPWLGSCMSDDYHNF